MLVRLLPTLMGLLAFLALFAEARPFRGTLQARKLTLEERGMTNSERLARGLPPRAPTWNRILPGRDVPTKARRWGASASASPSPSPSPSSSPSLFTGRVQVKSSKGVSIGFVNNTDTVLGSVDVKDIEHTDIEVKLTKTLSSNPVSILVSNPAFKGPVFLGGGSNATLDTTGTNVVNITNVPQTKAGAPPTPSGASAIWTIDSKSKQLAAQWVNIDGTTPATTIAYDASANSLFLTGNLAAWNAIANTTAEPVDLFVVH